MIKKLPFKFSTCFTNAMIQLPFQTMTSKTGSIVYGYQFVIPKNEFSIWKNLICVFEILKILKTFVLKERQTCFQEFYIITAFEIAFDCAFHL